VDSIKHFLAYDKKYGNLTCVFPCCRLFQQYRYIRIWLWISMWLHRETQTYTFEVSKKMLHKSWAKHNTNDVGYLPCVTNIRPIITLSMNGSDWQMTFWLHTNPNILPAHINNNLLLPNLHSRSLYRAWQTCGLRQISSGESCMHM
jgi:hypothetical protein